MRFFFCFCFSGLEMEEGEERGGEEGECPPLLDLFVVDRKGDDCLRSNIAFSFEGLRKKEGEEEEREGGCSEGESSGDELNDSNEEEGEGKKEGKGEGEGVDLVEEKGLGNSETNFDFNLFDTPSSSASSSSSSSSPSSSTSLLSPPSPPKTLQASHFFNVPTYLSSSSSSSPSSPPPFILGETPPPSPSEPKKLRVGVTWLEDTQEEKKKVKEEDKKKCFNCGGEDHELRGCPFPRDKKKIEQNREGYFFGCRFLIIPFSLFTLFLTSPPSPFPFSFLSPQNTGPLVQIGHHQQRDIIDFLKKKIPFVVIMINIALVLSQKN